MKNWFQQRQEKKTIERVFFNAEYRLNKLREDKEKHFDENEKYYLLNTNDSDKYLFTITSATIGLLLAFIKEKGAETTFKLFGFISIIELGLCLLFLVGSSLLAVRATQMRRMQKEILEFRKPNFKKLNIRPELIKSLLLDYQIKFDEKSNRSEGLHLFAVSAFLSGAIASIVFVSLNVFKIMGIAIEETTTTSSLLMIILVILPFYLNFYFS